MTVMRLGLISTLLSLSVLANAHGVNDQAAGRLSHLRSRKTPSVETSFVTLPLSKLGARKTGAGHPQVFLQEAINQGLARYNEFLPDLTPLTFDDLLSKMKLRVEAILAEAKKDELDKRAIDFRNHPWTGGKLREYFCSGVDQRAESVVD